MTRNEIIKKMEIMLEECNELLYYVTMECDIDLYEELKYYDMSQLEDFYNTEGKSILDILNDMKLMKYSDRYFYINEVDGYTSFSNLSDYIDRVASYINIDDVINYIESFGGNFKYISDDFNELATNLYYEDYDDNEDI